MEAIGAAQRMSAAARSAATPAPAAPLLPSGGAVAPTPEPVVTTTRITPMAIELTTVQGSELLGVQTLIQRAGLPITATSSEPSAATLISEAKAEQRSGQKAPRQSIELQAQIDGLMADLLAGRGDQRELVRVLDALRQLVKVVQRSEDRRDFIKDLLIKAMLGAVTPQMLRRAKELGLEEVVKRVIADAAKSGYISKAAAAPLAQALRAVGIVVPELDVLVDDLRSAEVKQDAALDDARRAQEQLIKDPLASGTPDGGVRTARDPLAAGAGSAPIASANAGVRAFE